jgi:hypothetical protein
MVANRPTIFLVNPISRHGHLDLYARLYSACALELGYRVVLIAEHETGVGGWLREHYAEHVDHFVFFVRSDLRESAVRSAGIADIGRRFFLSARRPFDRIVSFAIRRSMLAKRVRDALFSQPHGLSFRSVVDEIGVAGQRLGARPDLVFFLYLDMMDDDREECRYLDERLNSPWAGILFHPRHPAGDHVVRSERYFDCRNARGAAFLNPHCVEPYVRRFPNLVFASLPDVTDASIASDPPDLVARLRNRARGRTVVALLGSVGPHKGVMEFLEVIERADPREYFFVIVGEVFFETFGIHESALRSFFVAPPENCFVHVGYLEDERELNSVIVACDILYAVYQNQRDSSNSLTKAAIFETPIVVSRQDLMGERVDGFKIGATVRFGDTEGILAALAVVRMQPASEFGFAAYRAAHSFEALKAAFGGLVASWTRSSESSRTQPVVTGHTST